MQILSIKNSIDLLHDLSSVAQGLYENKQAKSYAYPYELFDGINQLLSMAQQIENGEANEPLTSSDISEIGDYGMQLLISLYTWAKENEPSLSPAKIQQLVIVHTDWIIRHGGQLQTIEPVVDTLAQFANQAQDSRELQDLCEFMRRVIGACDASIKNDLEQTNPGRSWRTLHLNYGITATRTHNTVLMRKVFDELTSVLPQDAPNFFTQGMQEMKRLNYPRHVREVMQEYFEHWSDRVMH